MRERAEVELTTFCSNRVPLRARHQVRLEHVFRGTTATIVEARPPWHPELTGQSWTRVRIAQFRYDLESGRWTLFWADRNGSWHTDGGAEPSGDLRALLAEVDRDPTGIYWG